MDSWIERIATKIIVTHTCIGGKSNAAAFSEMHSLQTWHFDRVCQAGIRVKVIDYLDSGALLKLCVAENALLLPSHFKAPSVARVHNANDVFIARFVWEDG